MKTVLLSNSDLFALVDDEDFALVDSQLSERGDPLEWRLNSDGYACCGKGNLLMHVLIKSPVPKGMMVDHKDGNRLNNQRENLRITSHQENNRNRGWNREKGYKGVFRKPNGRWKASISVDDKTLYLGTFSTAEEAAQAYDQAATLHFGEMAKLNFPKERS